MRDVVRRDFLDAFHRSATGRLFGLVETLYPDNPEPAKRLVASVITELQSKVGKEFDKALERLM